jgi:hypothetical protein
MKASVIDLRYRMKEVLKAINRNEEVTILYHGKVKGVIKPNVFRGSMRVSDHPFFGMSPSKNKVRDVLSDLRGDRYHVI